jgi:NADH-quinone oxidoreductase subunit L
VRGGTWLAKALWAAGALTALLTAFYTFRLVALTFFGEPRFDPREVHPHESPPVMTAPLAILAVLALVGGMLGLPEVVAPDVNFLHHWLAPVVAKAAPLAALGGPPGEGHGLGHSAELTFMIYSAIIAVVGIVAGFLLYRRGPQRMTRLAEALRPVHVLLYGKWFVDEVYELLVLAPLAMLARAAAWFDRRVVDGAVDGVATVAQRVGRGVRQMHDGHLQTYALWMAGGTAVLVAIVVFQLL